MRMFGARLFIALWMVFCLSGLAQASVIIGKTRVVFPSDKKEVTVQLTNLDDVPKLVQVWLDDGRKDVAPDLLDVPFQILNPVFRMNPKKGQVLRILALPNHLPKDRESVYWMNVLEVAPKPDVAPSDNYIQISFRTRIKLFYRPKGLSGKASEAGDKLVWKRSGDSLLVSNPTPYYVSISLVQTAGADGKFTPANLDMLDPFAAAIKVVSKQAATSISSVEYSYIDDLGATRKAVIEVE